MTAAYRANRKDRFRRIVPYGDFKKSTFSSPIMSAAATLAFCGVSAVKIGSPKIIPVAQRLGDFIGIFIVAS